jgi:hypothetical protein
MVFRLAQSLEKSRPQLMPCASVTGVEGEARRGKFLSGISPGHLRWRGVVSEKGKSQQGEQCLVKPN